MNILDSLVFLHPFWGLGTFLLWCVTIFLYIQTRKNAQEFAFLQDIETVFGKQREYFYINTIFLIVLILLFSLLIADPNKTIVQEKINREGIDIAIVLDLSYSMLADDITPNRLKVAKAVIADFINQLQTDRVGIILFAGKPFHSVPLTFEYDFLENFVKNISIKSINQDYRHMQGTAIGDALLYGNNLFDAESDREKVIVLLTDGEINQGIDPLDAIRYINLNKVTVHTVGIWGNEDTFVTIRNRYGVQKIGIWWIDENNLKAIANTTGGKYYRADSNATFEQLFSELDLIEKKDIEVETIHRYVPQYTFFVYALLIFLFWFTGFNTYYLIRR